MYQGECIDLKRLDAGFAELCFDCRGDAVNKLDVRTMIELGEAMRLLSAATDLRGVLITSSKPEFLVDADAKDYAALFRHGAQAIADQAWAHGQLLCALEDLAVPTVVAINGLALGGGLELALSASLRVMSSQAQVGVPQVKLGLLPRYGGTVRLLRIADPSTALDWVCKGRSAGAEEALAAGVVDEVAEPQQLRARALALLESAANGELGWQRRQDRKRQPVALALDALDSVFEPVWLRVRAHSPSHQPAATMAVQMMRAACREPREVAARLEVDAFGQAAKTQAASSLVQALLSEQEMKSQAQGRAQAARPISSGAVLGAGIMGASIAYASAMRSVPVRLKDIADGQLDLGMAEVRRLLARRVGSGGTTQAGAAAILHDITAQLDYAGFDTVDVVIEAVSENLTLKHALFAELESVLGPEAIIASNTSSLRIDDLAVALHRPERLVGLHFFNPAWAMPLVEVIQGSRTDPRIVADVVGYCLALGKIPIVVQDSPGFLVNRVFAAFMRGFLELISDGADFTEVDAVMEAFGWPMGPAHLQDVLGIDICSHACDAISAGYAERMPRIELDALRLMAQRGRYGRKNGLGFYAYEIDEKGKLRRNLAADIHELLATIQTHGQRRFDTAEIIDRLMLPLIFEAVRALEDGIVQGPAELDTALLLGLGLPAYLGGALKYADWLGAAQLVARAGRLSALGPMYRVPETLKRMLLTGDTFYNN